MGASLTPQDAEALVRDLAIRRAVQIALMSGLAAAGARTVLGVGSSIFRRKSKPKGPLSSSVDIVLPTKRAESGLPVVPDWYPAAVLLSVLLAGFAGWAGAGQLFQRLRQARRKRELRKAEQEFDEALRDERRQSKFAMQLDAVAQAWANGELDAALSKRADFSPLRTIPQGVYALMAVATALGALTGWKTWGKSENEQRVKAYQEYTRRRRVGQPLPLAIHRVQEPTDEETT